MTACPPTSSNPKESKAQTESTACAYICSASAVYSGFMSAHSVFASASAQLLHLNLLSVCIWACSSSALHLLNICHVSSVPVFPRGSPVHHCLLCTCSASQLSPARSPIPRRCQRNILHSVLHAGAFPASASPPSLEPGGCRLTKQVAWICGRDEPSHPPGTRDRAFFPLTPCTTDLSPLFLLSCHLPTSPSLPSWPSLAAPGPGTPLGAPPALSTPPPPPAGC